jgi:hypothetical protein
MHGVRGTYNSLNHGRNKSFYHFNCSRPREEYIIAMARYLAPGAINAKSCRHTMTTSEMGSEEMSK